MNDLLIGGALVVAGICGYVAGVESVVDHPRLCITDDYDLQPEWYGGVYAMTTPYETPWDRAFAFPDSKRFCAINQNDPATFMVVCFDSETLP